MDGEEALRKAKKGRACDDEKKDGKQEQEEAGVEVDENGQTDKGRACKAITR